MTILIVDDDLAFLEGLRERLPWECLGIDTVLTAGSSRQAKSLWPDAGVDILLSDIEMPGESGLDLIAWVRQRQETVQVLLLTSYADFRYAQRAIALQSLMYFLKPVDYHQLEEGLAKAVALAKAAGDSLSRDQNSRYWENNKRHIKSHFWQELLTCQIEPGDRAVFASARDRGLQYQPADRFVALVFSPHQTPRTAAPASRQILFNELSALAKRWVDNEGFQMENATVLAEDVWVIVLQLTDEVNSLVGVENYASALLTGAERAFSQGFACGIGDILPLGAVSQNVHQVQDMLRELADESGQPCLLCTYQRRELPYNLPFIPLWGQLLEKGETAALLANIQEYWEQAKSQGRVNAHTLRLFRLDLTQLVYTFLQSKKVEARLLFADQTSETLYQRAESSVREMTAFADHFIMRASGYVADLQEPSSVVEILRAYLDENYTQQITRTDLAQLVYLTPDHISHLFKQHTGTTINNYLLDKRVERAKQMLRYTTLPIHMIAMEVGYWNFAYFSKLFRERSGMTPNAYRRHFRQTELTDGKSAEKMSIEDLQKIEEK